MASLAESLLSIAKEHRNGPAESEPYIANIKRAEDEINNTGDASNRAATVCKVANAVFGKDRVILPQSSAYQGGQQGFWSEICEMPCACFIKPTNALEVALAIKILTTTQTKFAIRSGGHMPNPGWNGVGSDGIIFDLSAMNHLKFHEEHKTLSTGPGARWTDVQKYLEPFERVAVGGRIGGIGVAGFVTGGGMSHFVNYYGMSCDNVKNFEVVLGDSRIVNANENENPELFKALKGGSANFGIVTKFELYTHPDYKIWQRVYVYDHKDTALVARAAERVHAAMEVDDQIGMTLRIMPEYYMVILWHRSEVEPGATPPSFEKAFEGLAPSQVMLPGTNMTTAAVISAWELPRTRTAFGGITVAKDQETYTDLFQWIVDNVNTLGVRVDFSLQPLVARHVEYAEKMGGNVMGMAKKSESMLGWVTTWSDAKQDQEAKDLTSSLYGDMKAISDKRGNHVDWIFMNDAWVDQDVMKGYGPENVEFMRRVSSKYDPGQVYQKLQNNGFLLSRSGAP